jgi:hypothetical protein
MQQPFTAACPDCCSLRSGTGKTTIILHLLLEREMHYMAAQQQQQHQQQAGGAGPAAAAAAAGQAGPALLQAVVSLSPMLVESLRQQYYRIRRAVLTVASLERAGVVEEDAAADEQHEVGGS